MRSEITCGSPLMVDVAEIDVAAVDVAAVDVAAVDR